MIYSSCISKFHACIFVICSFVICAQSDVPRPRGVSLSKASLYSPTKDFTCFDGTATIPFNYVNDDYCDCFDGSDEPGTSACLNGIFHCTNAGHRAHNIPSSRVNDGVCDCCDGTDEYASENKCANTCEELGKEARAEAQRLAELHKAGGQLRLELIEKGNKKRGEMAEQLAQLEKDKTEAENIRTEKEALKTELEKKENEALQVYRDAEEREKEKKAEKEREAEIKEASDFFDRVDSNSDGQLTIEEIKVVNTFDKNKDGEVDDEEFEYFFNEKDSVINIQTFVTSTWPILKPLIMMEQGMFKPASEEAEEREVFSEDDADEFTRDLDGEELGTDDDNVDSEVPQEEHVEQDDSKQYDPETQRLIYEATEARKHLSDAERTVREIESNIRNIKQNLDKDYGLQQEFATLDGQCLEYEDKEYIYKLCLFQKVTQQSKNGGAEVGLGNWGQWVGDEKDYSTMSYKNGMACWNGPQRSTNVNIQCGLETKLLSVTEPYRCEYKMELITPAACDDSNLQQDQSSHDEL